MLQLKRKERLAATKHISFDANKCEACWKCIPACSNNVIGKVDLFFHKHARIVNRDECSGCLKCVRACPCAAFEKLKDN
jgi:ferredoxin